MTERHELERMTYQVQVPKENILTQVAPEIGVYDPSPEHPTQIEEERL